MAEDNTNDLLKEFLTRALLLRIGQRAVFIINSRLDEGRFLEGSSEGAEVYSEKPFAMPFGAIKKKSVQDKILKGKYDDTHLFRAKSGRLWVLLDKGYKWLREESGRQTSKVDLTWTAELRRSLKVQDVDTDTFEISIYHTGDRNQKLSQYFNELGVGRSKRLRKYLGLSQDELSGLADMINTEEGI